MIVMLVGFQERLCFHRSATGMHSVALGDYDGDGDVDMVMAVSIGNLPFEALPAVGETQLDGSLKQIKGVDAGLNAREVRGGGPRFMDIDNDGNLDLFIMARKFARTGGISHIVYENLGGGNFVEKSNSGLETSGKGSGFLVTDFNEDGSLDIILLGNCMEWWQSNGNFAFAK